MTDALAGLRAAPRRPQALAALLSLLVALALAAGHGLTGGPDAKLAAPRVGETAAPGLSSLPVAAQAQVSSRLGADDPAYGVSTLGAGALRASNPAQHLTAAFNRSGVHLEAGGLSVEMGLRAIGSGSSLTALAPVEPTAAGNRVTFARDGLSEWYANGPLGIEQGFTVARPRSSAAGALTVSIALGGNARASLSGDRRVLSFSRPGSRSLAYGGLAAVDAHGRNLPVHMQLRGGRLLLGVQADGAAYPLRIDPLVQERKLEGGAEELEPRGEPPVEVAHGAFGYSVALSADGNTALIGAPGDQGFSGAVWVFTRSAGVWSQQGPKLVGPEEGGPGAAECDTEVGSEAEQCAFGRSVALSADGNTALIGGPRQNGSQGAAWVFTRTGSAWSAASTLTGGSEESQEGRFGRSVALSGDGATAVVGASADHGGRGSVWVFTRAGSSWSQAGPILTGSGEIGEAHFGRSVSVSGDGTTALIGGPGDRDYLGAAWLLSRAGSGWSQQKLTGAGEAQAGHFGASVALSTDGSTALVGARHDAGGAGAAWAFTKSGSTWTALGAKLTGDTTEVAGGEGEFGYSLALSGDGTSALIGAPHDEEAIGSAWLFTRTPGGFSQEGPKLVSSAVEAKGKVRKGAFGSSVALREDGQSALVGAPSEGSTAGAVWSFVEPGSLPFVENVSPEAGPTSGGTVVRIAGTLAGATSVGFGSAAVDSFVLDPFDAITVVAPPSPTGHPGSVCVSVMTPKGTSATDASCHLFTYMAVPAISELAPASGPAAGGTVVTITGSNFARVGAVRFGSVSAASFSVAPTGTSITAVTPAEPEGEVPVTVTTPGGTSPGRHAFLFTPAAGSAGSSSGAHTGQVGGVLGFGPASARCSASLLSRRIAVVSHVRAAVKLRWRGAGICRGRLTLRVKVKVRVGHRVKTAMRTIASGSFSLPSGGTRTFALALNAAGRSMLRARHGRLNASLSIAAAGAAAATARTASVRLAVPARHTARKPSK